MNKYFLLLSYIIAFNLSANSQSTRIKLNLLPDDSLIFKKNLNQLPHNALSLVAVNGQQFKQAYQLSTFDAERQRGMTLECPINEQIDQGDVLLLSFYTRSLKSVKETGESFFEISLNRTIREKFEWPPLFERGLSFGRDWVLTQVPFTAAMSVKRGELSLVIKPGDFPQEIEIGGLSVVNYKRSIKMIELPKSVVHYEGDSPNAPWRKVADFRINKYRKGDLSIHVSDKSGKPVKGVTISINMQRSAYGFGTAIDSKLLLDTLDANSRKYSDTLLRYFNKIVFANEVKSRGWARADHNKTIAAIHWLKAHQINPRGHVMVWPSWQNSPHLSKYKNDTAGLRKGIITDITDETRVLKGQFSEWDVVNEPFAHHVFLDLLGRHAMVDWFNTARQLAPGVKLFLNDYTMFHGDGPGSDSERFYENVKYLQQQHAPIDAIGEQAHIGGTPPGIDHIIARLDHFAELSLPIQISEFDITSDDDDFKARYLRDFMTAVFSHPATIGIIQWGFWESDHWIPAAALWDKNWEIRKHGRVYTELVTRTWRTNVKGISDKNGNYYIRGFCGNYLITLEKNHNKKILNATLTTLGKKLTASLK